MTIKPDFLNFMTEAKKMQDVLQNAQKELENTTLIGESGAGLVSIEMNGKHQVKKVSFDNELLSQSKEVIEELIAAAFNDGVNKVSSYTQDKFPQLANLFKNPFAT